MSQHILPQSQVGGSFDHTCMPPMSMACPSDAAWCEDPTGCVLRPTPDHAVRLAEAHGLKRRPPIVCRYSTVTNLVARKNDWRGNCGNPRQPLLRIVERVRPKICAPFESMRQGRPWASAGQF